MHAESADADLPSGDEARIVRSIGRCVARVAPCISQLDAHRRQLACALLQLGLRARELRGGGGVRGGCGVALSCTPAHGALALRRSIRKFKVEATGALAGCMQ
jgi:hypothetical protein